MSDIIIYTTEDGETRIDLRLENETAWLSQLQIAELFQTSKQNISKHIQAIYTDGELDAQATVNQTLTVQTEGQRKVTRSTVLYNLDVILAVGYRDFVRELDTILSSAGRKLLSNAGKVSHLQAENKARQELQKYKAKTLAAVEKDYLQAITDLGKQAKKAARQNGGKA